VILGRKTHPNLNQNEYLPFDIPIAFDDGPWPSVHYDLSQQQFTSSSVLHAINGLTARKFIQWKLYFKLYLYQN